METIYDQNYGMFCLRLSFFYINKLHASPNLVPTTK